MIEDGCGLPVHIVKAFRKQLLLAVEVAVQRAGGDPGQLADVLNAHALQAILPHGLHRGEYDPHFGVIQTIHFPPQSPPHPARL